MSASITPQVHNPIGSEGVHRGTRTWRRAGWVSDRRLHIAGGLGAPSAPSSQVSDFCLSGPGRTD
jgi:hypothetical protein